MDTDATTEIIKQGSKKHYVIDSMSNKNPRTNMEIKPFLNNGLIDDWNLYENVLQYILKKHLKCDASKHPILMTEPVVSYLFIINY